MPADKLVRNVDLFQRIAIDNQFVYSAKNVNAYRTPEVALRKSLPGSSPLLSGHGTYTDLQVESERGSTLDAGSGDYAPEETADMTGAQAGDVDLTESGLIEVDRTYIIAELLAQEPCKVDMTILAFIGNEIPSRDQKNDRRWRSAKWRGPRRNA
jgi:hypothetical protein